MQDRALKPCAVFVIKIIHGADAELCIDVLGDPVGHELPIEQIDDATNYETRKTVEDSCRAMIASYEADKLTYEQYKDSESDEQRSWADQAKMRANRTAANYNNYILKNSYVWSGNIPEDILAELPVLE